MPADLVVRLLKRAFEQHYQQHRRRCRHQDHRRGRQAATTDPPLQERAIRTSRSRWTCSYTGVDVPDLQSRVPAPGPQPYLSTRSRQNATACAAKSARRPSHLRCGKNLRSPAGPDRHAARGGQPSSPSPISRGACAGNETASASAVRDRFVPSSSVGNAT